MNASDNGAFLPGLLIVLGSWAVIVWAIAQAWPAPEPIAQTIESCVRAGHVETPRGPVFCVLVEKREE